VYITIYRDWGKKLQAGAGVGAPFVAAGIQDVFVAKQVMPVMRQWL
jgi:hypothetical protein